MVLPDPADTRDCLRYVGLSDEKIAQVEQKLHEEFLDFQGPNCGYEENFLPSGVNVIKFPGVDKMLSVYYGKVDHTSSDHEYSHEGYIKKGIQQGMRPEFAVVCGLHEDDPRSIEDPLLFERDWFDTSASSIISDWIGTFWMTLEGLLTCKLVHEGKAWCDERDGQKASRWLVHEGESIDQARAKVNNLDLQHLRERAFQEVKERSKRESEAHNRKIEREVAESEAEYRAAGGE